MMEVGELDANPQGYFRIFTIVYVGNLDKGQGLLCIISIMVIGNLDMDLGGSLDYFRNN